MHKVVLSVGLAATVLLSGGIDIFAQASGNNQVRIRTFKGRTYRSPNYVEQARVDR